jgi:hypothetical protein
MGVNTTVVPGQNAPDGDEVKATDGVTGAVTDSEPKLVPPTPNDTPATPDATDAIILPAAAVVVSGCTCRPLIITWSAMVVPVALMFTVSAVLLIKPETPVILDPVI